MTRFIENPGEWHNLVETLQAKFNEYDDVWINESWIEPDNTQLISLSFKDDDGLHYQYDITVAGGMPVNEDDSWN